MTLSARSITVPFYRNRRFYLGIAGLIAVILTPILVYYEMSYNSVNGTTVQIASVHRTVSRSFFGGIDSVAYYVEAHVWSYATSIDTRVNNPLFSLLVDSYPVGYSVTGGSGTFKVNGYLIYSLTFTTLDGPVASAIGQESTNHLLLGMDALMSAGIYQSQVTVSDSSNPTF